MSKYIDNSVSNGSSKTNQARRSLVIIGLNVVLIAGVAAGVLFYMTKNAIPVPAKYRSTVDYPVYYPQTSKLPMGYKLVANSFTSPASNVILYKISYGTSQIIYISLQNKPSASDLQAFTSQRIPLHTTVSTPVGKATVGAIGNQTVVSLPTTTKAWVLVTAPYSINQGQLTKVLRSLKQ